MNYDHAANFYNHVQLSGLIAWTIAQLVKVPEFSNPSLELGAAFRAGRM
jgi:hypothetical protein